jgi:hypothetical protein
MTRVNDAWEADQMLNAYILDYFRKKQFTQSCETFMQEANVSQDHVLINAPEGFLFEWWAVFWDIYNARNNKPSSSDARTYVEYQKYRHHLQQALAQPGAAAPTTITSNAFNINNVNNVNNPTYNNPAFNRLVLNHDMMNVASNTNNLIPVNATLGNNNLLGSMMGNNTMANSMSASTAPSPQMTQTVQLGQMPSPVQMPGNSMSEFSSKQMDQKMSTGNMLPLPPTLPNTQQSNSSNSSSIKQEGESAEMQDFKRSGELQNLQQQMLASQNPSMMPSHFPNNNPNQPASNMGVQRWYTPPGVHMIPTGAPLAYFQPEQVYFFINDLFFH